MRFTNFISFPLLSNMQVWIKLVVVQPCRGCFAVTHIIIMGKDAENAEVTEHAVVKDGIGLPLPKG